MNLRTANNRRKRRANLASGKRGWAVRTMRFYNAQSATLDSRKVHYTTIDRHGDGQTTRRALGKPFTQVDDAWVSDLTGWEVRMVRIPPMIEVTP